MSTGAPQFDEMSNSSAIDGADDEIDLLDLASVIAANLRLLILGPLAAGLVALGITFLITPTFTAKTTFLPPQQSSGGVSALLGSLGGLAGAAAGLKSPGDQYIAYLQSNTLLDQLIQKYDLQKRYEQEYLFQTRKALLNRTKINPEKMSGLISLEVHDPDPTFAAELANAYIATLSSMLGKLAIEETQAKQNLLDEQIAQATTKTYRNPIVRDAVLQGLLREYEATSLDRQREETFISQVDVAQVPEYKSTPKRAQIAMLASLASGFLLILFLFVRHALQNVDRDPQSNEKLRFIHMTLRKQICFWRHFQSRD
jgi:uncharacterized protein involved in exopolysaccharide biosynthesis